MKRLFTYLAISLCLGSVQAQLVVDREAVEFSPAYFVSFDNDTIYGDLNYGKKLFGGLLTKIIFTDAEGYRYKLRANEVNGFSMNGQTYESKLIDDFYYFMRPAVSGRPALYYLENNYVNRKKLSLEMIRAQGVTGRVIHTYVEVSGRMHKLYKKRFKRQATQLFTAYPEVVDKIFEDELSFYDIEQIITYCNLANQGLSNPEDAEIEKARRKL